MTDLAYTRVPYALTLSLLIYAEKANIQGGGLEYATYTVLDTAAVLAGWSEDRRADLYARIVDKLPTAHTETFINVQRAVSRAILEHTRQWH